MRAARLLEDGDVERSGGSLAGGVVALAGRCARTTWPTRRSRARTSTRSRSCGSQTLEDRIDADLALGRHERARRRSSRARAPPPAPRAAARPADDRALPLRPAGGGTRGLPRGAAVRCSTSWDRAGARAARARAGDPAARIPHSASPCVAPPVPIAGEHRRRWLVAVAASSLRRQSRPRLFATRRSLDTPRPVAVKPHSVAVIDPKRNAVVRRHLRLAATQGRSRPTGRTSTSATSATRPSRGSCPDSGSSTTRRLLARDRPVAGQRELWAANGGVAGHTPARHSGTAWTSTCCTGPDRRGRSGSGRTSTAATRNRRRSPPTPRAPVWVGNKDSRDSEAARPRRRAVLITIHGVAPGGLAVVGELECSATRSGRAIRPGTSSSGSTNITRRIVHQIHDPEFPSRRRGRRARGLGRSRADSSGPEWRADAGDEAALWRIDPATNKPVARIHAAADADPGRARRRLGLGDRPARAVFATATADATVLRIDPATNRIVARIPLALRAPSTGSSSATASSGRQCHLPSSGCLRGELPGGRASARPKRRSTIPWSGPPSARPTYTPATPRPRWPARCLQNACGWPQE